MKVVAFVSGKGGTGRTTLAANTAAALALEGRACAALDLDPQNALGTHFGMSPGERVGIGPAAASRAELLDYVAAHHPALPHIPFGWRSPAELRLGEATVSREPLSLTLGLGELLPSETELVLVDTPAGDNPWLHCALAMCDVVIAVHLPDAACFATLPRLTGLLHAARRDRPLVTWHLVNQMDGRSGLARDALAAFGHALGELLLPFTVARDPAVPEALAMQLPLVRYEPESGALAGVRALSERLAALLRAGEQQGASPGGPAR